MSIHKYYRTLRCWYTAVFLRCQDINIIWRVQWNIPVCPTIPRCTVYILLGDKKFTTRYLLQWHCIICVLWWNNTPQYLLWRQYLNIVWRWNVYTPITTRIPRICILYGDEMYIPSNYYEAKDMYIDWCQGYVQYIVRRWNVYTPVTTTIPGICILSGDEMYTPVITRRPRICTV